MLVFEIVGAVLVVLFFAALMSPEIRSREG